MVRKYLKFGVQTSRLEPYRPRALLEFNEGQKWSGKFGQPAHWRAVVA